MRDWLLLFAPLGLVMYFLMYPDQFHVFMAWAQHLID